MNSPLISKPIKATARIMAMKTSFVKLAVILRDVEQIKLHWRNCGPLTSKFSATETHDRRGTPYFSKCGEGF